MSLVRRAVGATAITAASRSSVPSALRRLAAPLVFLVALLAVSLGIASPALAAAPTAGNFGPGGTAYNSGSNPPLVFSVLPHVAGGATSFAMTSATSDMGGTVSITNGGTVTYVPPIGFKGTDWVYYTASNVDGTSAVATIHISVNWPIIAVTLPSNLGTVGVPYNVGGAPLVISGGFAPYTISFSDPFPAGLSFNPATRVLSGTPTSAGGVDVNYIVEDSSYGQTGNQVEPGWFTLNIAAPTITVAPASLGGTPQIGAAYSQTLTASGGASPYSYSITAGALPAGLTLSAAGVISGTPTAAGAFSATVKATDNSGYPGTRVYAATIVGPAMTVGAGPLPGGSLGAAYTASVTATGGTGPYTYDRAFGTLPTGLTLSPSGALSGTPTAGGTFNFTVRATVCTDPVPWAGSSSTGRAVPPSTVWKRRAKPKFPPLRMRAPRTTA